MRRFLLLTLCLLAVSLGYGQKRNVKAHTAKAKPVVQKANPLYESMLDNTAKVLFIDSIVVDKDSFLYYIPLNREAGEVMQMKGDVVYTNEFGNLRYIATGDSATRHLAVSDRLGDVWTEPETLRGISHEYATPDYPFMSSDGTTLYFAARGHEAIGGYDIFTTIFDSDSARFFKPENMGLPFNSKYNEYFMAIDDLDSLGWLVSDRYQPEGKVCVYTFVPTATRESFDEDVTEATLRRYADLRSILDTRHFGDLDAALNRLTNLLQRNNTQEAEAQRFSFVISDDRTYHDISEFRSADALKQFRQYQELSQMLQQQENQLTQLRDAYAAKRSTATAQSIRKLEQSIDSLYKDRDTVAKSVRNKEIKQLPNN